MAIKVKLIKQRLEHMTQFIKKVPGNLDLDVNTLKSATNRDTLKEVMGNQNSSGAFEEVSRLAGRQIIRTKSQAPSKLDLIKDEFEETDLHPLYAE